MSLTKEQLAHMIDHTNLKAYATREDMRTLCDDAGASRLGTSAGAAICDELAASER